MQIKTYARSEIRSQPIEPVRTKEDVANIFAANRELTRLSACWFAAVVRKDQLEASRIRRESNGIKQRILAEYNIIL
jgi:hypothetical protein